MWIQYIFVTCHAIPNLSRLRIDFPYFDNFYIHIEFYVDCISMCQIRLFKYPFFPAEDVTFDPKIDFEFLPLSSPTNIRWTILMKLYFSRVDSENKGILFLWMYRMYIACFVLYPDQYEDCCRINHCLTLCWSRGRTPPLWGNCRLLNKRNTRTSVSKEMDDHLFEWENV